MKNLYILTSAVSEKLYIQKGFVIKEESFSPFESIFEKYPELEPESFNRIYVVGVFERCKYLRCVIKSIDWLLSVRGIVEFDYCFCSLDHGYAVRSLDEVRYEISSTFKNRVRFLKMEKGDIWHISFEKTHQSLAADDRIDRWTFGIVSNGTKNDRILQIIDRIASFEITNYEIIICGPSPSANLPDEVRVISDEDMYPDIRIPIARKKNAIIFNAKFENLVIIHDRIMFSVTWYKDLCKFKNYFDCFIPAILDEETEERHVIDCSHFREKPINHYYFPKYRVYWSPRLYMDGSILIIKKSIAKENPLRDYLNWGEKEDVDFSKRLYDNGFLTNIFHQCKVTTLTYMKKGRKPQTDIISRSIDIILSFPRWLRMFIKEYYKYYKYIQRYEQNESK